MRRTFLSSRAARFATAIRFSSARFLVCVTRPGVPKHGPRPGYFIYYESSTHLARAMRAWKARYNVATTAESRVTARMAAVVVHRVERGLYSHSSHVSIRAPMLYHPYKFVRQVSHPLMRRDIDVLPVPLCFHLSCVHSTRCLVPACTRMWAIMLI